MRDILSVPLRISLNRFCLKPQKKSARRFDALHEKRRRSFPASFIPLGTLGLMEFMEVFARSQEVSRRCRSLDFSNRGRSVLTALFGLVKRLRIPCAL